MDVKGKPDSGDVGTILFQDGYHLAEEFTGRGISRSSLLALMHSAYEAIDGLLDSFCRRCEIEGLKVACKKGCAFCCNQAVLVSNHEILIIIHYLENNIEPDLVEGIVSRTLKRHEATRNMNAIEFLHYNHACPFLKAEKPAKGSCMIYPVRPVACRCYLSSDLQSCRDQYENSEDPHILAALFDFPLKAGRGMNEGIRSALFKRGLIPSEWLLESFMAAVFKNNEILNSWLDGIPLNIRKLTPDENRYLKEHFRSTS